LADYLWLKMFNSRQTFLTLTLCDGRARNLPR
jgi:hypothetical protein